jgi:hypothetical protein
VRAGQRERWIEPGPAMVAQVVHRVVVEEAHPAIPLEIGQTLAQALDTGRGFCALVE